MSELDQLPVLEPCTDVDAKAAEWLSCQQFDEWSGAQQAALDVWLSESETHVVAYWRLKAAWGRAARLAALRTGPAEKSYQYDWQAARSLLKMVAATGIIASILGTGVYVFSRPHVHSYSTIVGGRETLTLADGSRIDLNTDTVIRTEIRPDRRLVELVRGEAYFQVKHDAARPFVVVAAGHRVTDIGTAFSVRRSGERLEVALVEGRARFDSPGDPVAKTFDMMAGDKVVATAKGVVQSIKPMTALTNELGWRRGVLIFDGTTLAEAAAEFNRYSATKLVIPNPEVARLTINGTFQINNMKAFIDATQVVLGLKLEPRESEILISR